MVTLSPNDVGLWKQYLAKANEHKRIRSEVLKVCRANQDVMVELLKGSLVSPSEKDAALDFVRSVNVEAQKELFDELLPLASDLDVGSVNRAEQILLALPRDWLRERLAGAIQRYLDEPDLITPELLSLCFQVDRTLAHRLAERAAGSDNKDRRDLGDFFLQKLEQQTMDRI